MITSPAEENFIRGIRLTIHDSGEFRRAVLDGLTEFMGESPAEILVMGMSEAGFRSPAQFVREVSAVFGHGATGMYSAILSTSGDPSWVARGDGTVRYRPRTGGLASNEVGSLEQDGERTLYLHDHRDPDEFSEEDPH